MGRKEDFRVGVGGESDLTPFSCSKNEKHFFLTKIKEQQHAGQLTEELIYAEMRRSNFFVRPARGEGFFFFFFYYD